jgi:hypothetical protein
MLSVRKVSEIFDALTNGYFMLIDELRAIVDKEMCIHRFAENAGNGAISNTHETWR